MISASAALHSETHRYLHTNTAEELEEVRRPGFRAWSLPMLKLALALGLAAVAALDRVELHVHLDGSIEPETLLVVAQLAQAPSEAEAYERART